MSLVILKAPFGDDHESYDLALNPSEVLFIIQPRNRHPSGGAVSNVLLSGDISYAVFGSPEEVFSKLNLPRPFATLIDDDGDAFHVNPCKVVAVSPLRLISEDRPQEQVIVKLIGDEKIAIVGTVESVTKLLNQ